MTTYSIDNAHSDVAFTVRHMVFAKVRGHFTKWTADLKFDPTDANKSSIDVTIDAASIDTREAQRDGHLRSPDFFDAERFPKLTYSSRRVEKAVSGYKVVGDLTIHGVTHEVPLQVEELGRAKDPGGDERVAFHATASINRLDYGLKWNVALEAGGVLVGERIDLEIDVEAVAKKD